jgi:hypothetical protein
MVVIDSLVTISGFCRLPSTCNCNRRFYMKKLSFLLVLAFLTLAGCSDSDNNNINNLNNVNNTDPCSKVTCDSNSSCQLTESNNANCVCDSGYTEEDDVCINFKLVNCTWDATSGWSDPEPCEWDCVEGYVQDGTACLVTTEEVPLDGFGEITGQCGVLTPTELQTDQHYYYLNTIDFGNDTYDASDFIYLSSGGQILAETENAGGSSSWSEVFAYEMLYRCELGLLLKTETEIIYDEQGSITDILVEIDQFKIGVSVTRAMSWPRDTPLDPISTQDLLESKLLGIQESTQNVADVDVWVKQILHVLADRVEHVDVIESALEDIDPLVKGDTIIIITVTDGLDDFIYTNEI